MQSYRTDVRSDCRSMEVHMHCTEDIHIFRLSIFFETASAIPSSHVKEDTKARCRDYQEHDLRRNARRPVTARKADQTSKNIVFSETPADHCRLCWTLFTMAFAEPLGFYMIRNSGIWPVFLATRLRAFRIPARRVPN